MVTNHNGAVGLIVSPIHPPAPAGPTPNLAVVGNVARTGGLFTPAYLQVQRTGPLDSTPVTQPGRWCFHLRTWYPKDLARTTPHWQRDP